VAVVAAFVAASPALARAKPTTEVVVTLRGPSLADAASGT